MPTGLRMKPEFRQSDRPQLFENAAIELLECVDLLQDRAAVLSQRIGVGRGNLRKPHQGAGMREE